MIFFLVHKWEIWNAHQSLILLSQLSARPSCKHGSLVKPSRIEGRAQCYHSKILPSDYASFIISPQLCIVFFPFFNPVFFLEKDLLVPSWSIIMTLVIFTKQPILTVGRSFFIYVFTIHKQIFLLMNYNYLPYIVFTSLPPDNLIFVAMIDDISRGNV